MAELADAIDLGSISKEWGFKSLYPHHTKASGFIVKRNCNPLDCFFFFLFACAFVTTD